jgi:hypothetical protein
LNEEGTSYPKFSSFLYIIDAPLGLDAALRHYCGTVLAQSDMMRTYEQKNPGRSALKKRI